MRYQLDFLLFVLLTMPLAGCISVNLGGPKNSVKAKVSFVPPQAPFESLSVSTSDYSWKSAKTGSAIGLISDCDPSADLSLETLRDEVVQALKESTIVKATQLTYQGRAALRSVVTGEVDGIKTHIDLMVFKKNGCSYTISLVAIPRNATEDTPQFDRFLDQLVAP